MRGRKRSSAVESVMPTLRVAMDSLSTEYRKFFIKDELWQSYRAAGGTDLNAFTTDLGTAYHVILPRNRVEMFFWLEADRMVNAVMRDFYSERDVVREERRLRIENRPEGRYWESLEALFWGAHPYGIPTIGWPSDIENFTRSQIEEHYRKYYAPCNATLVLAGDIASDSAFALAVRYFGSITKGAAFPEVRTRDPEPVGQKRFVSIRENARPSINLMIPTPAIDSPESPAFEILEGVLSGAAGRLEPILVDSLRLATDAGAANDARRYASIFHVEATPAPGADPERIEALLWDAIATLRDSLVSERELERVRNSVVAARIAKLREMGYLAETLGFMSLHGDWRLISSYPESVQKVTAEDVRAAARKYLLPERATVGWLLPRNHSEATKTGVYRPVAEKR